MFLQWAARSGTAETFCAMPPKYSRPFMLCMSTVISLSTPAPASILAIHFMVTTSPGRNSRSCRAYPMYGTTAVTPSARPAASETMSMRRTRLASTGGWVDCTIVHRPESVPDTVSLDSPSGNVLTVQVTGVAPVARARFLASPACESSASMVPGNTCGHLIVRYKPLRASGLGPKIEEFPPS